MMEGPSASEIQEHLRNLDRYVVGSSSSQPLSVKNRIKAWLRTAKEMLAAEAISKALPDINRKIAASIQNFLLLGQVRVEATVDTIHNNIMILQDSHVTMQQGQAIIRQAQITKDERGESNPLRAPSDSNLKPDLLDRLLPVRSAFYNANGAARACQEGTRLQVLEDVSRWFYNPLSRPIYWISGIAGTGKTTIAQSICLILQQGLGATFFCSRDDFDRREPSKILPTIIYQLAYFDPRFRRAICDTLSNNPDIALQGVQNQVQKLLFQTLGPIAKPDIPSTLLLFDALDECSGKNGEGLRDFIPHLLNFVQLYPKLFRIVFTSRPESYIRRMLEGGRSHTYPFILHDVDADVVRRDIEVYLRFELARIAEERNLENVWPTHTREEHVAKLAELADRLFIFAATAAKVLSQSNVPHRKVESFFSKFSRSPHLLYGALDRLYFQVIIAVIPDNKDEVEDTCAAFKCLIGAIVVLQQPLDLSSLGRLIDMDEALLNAIINPLCSVLDISNVAEQPIRVFHLSFPEFFIDDTRCTDPQLCVQPPTIHYVVAFRCLIVMNEQLCQDICKIQDSSLLNAQIEGLSEYCERFTSTELRYACSYWWTHLVYVEFVTELLVSELKIFVSERLLQWLELLSLMGSLRSALIGLPIAAAWCKGNARLQKEQSREELGNIATLLYDANRTTQAFFYPISKSALQVYESALTFMPHCSLLSHAHRLCFGKVKMMSDRRAYWSQDLHVMESLKERIKRLVVSSDGSLLASSSGKTIRVWDIASGVHLTCIDSISSAFVFSFDSSQLFTFLPQQNIQETWDVVSGIMLNTTQIFSDCNMLRILRASVVEAVSPNGDHIAFGLEDGALYVFATDETTAAQLQGHIGRIISLEFSRDSSLVLSSSSDKTVRVWNAQSSCCIAKIEVGANYVSWSARISPDGQRVIVSEADPIYRKLGQESNLEKTDSSLGPTPIESRVWVYTMATREVSILIERIDYMEFNLLSISENSIAYVLVDNVVKKNDVALDGISLITWGGSVSSFKGHTDDVTCATFSPDGLYLVSGSKDCTIHVWDAQINAVDIPLPGGHNQKICSLVFSVDGATLISISEDKAICCWDIHLGRLTSKVEKEAKVAGVLSNGTVVGLYWKSYESTIDVWNAKTGEDIAILKGHSGDVNDVAFSPDFTRLASGSYDETVRIWDTATWECIVALKGHTWWVVCVGFSPDGSRVASGSLDNTVRVWNVATGDGLAVLEGHTRAVRSVDFSPDGSCVVSGSSDNTVRVWDAATGHTLAMLEGHKNWVTSVRFSSDQFSILSKDRGGEDREWKAGVDFPLPRSPSPLPPAFGLDDFGWLFATTSSFPHRRRRLCWLPIERRGNVYSSGFTIALGSESGIVTIISVLDATS